MSGKYRTMELAAGAGWHGTDSLWVQNAGALPETGSWKQAALELWSGVKLMVRGLGSLCCQMGKELGYALLETKSLTLWRETPEQIAKGGK